MRFFASLRMTGEGLRMTGEGLRMTGEGLRMTFSVFSVIRNRNYLMKIAPLSFVAEFRYYCSWLSLSKK